MLDEDEWFEEHELHIDKMTCPHAEKLWAMVEKEDTAEEGSYCMDELLAEFPGVVESEWLMGKGPLYDMYF